MRFIILAEIPASKNLGPAGVSFYDTYTNSRGLKPPQITVDVVLLYLYEQRNERESRNTYNYI